jgi:hypothetical protein
MATKVHQHTRDDIVKLAEEGDDNAIRKYQGLRQGSYLLRLLPMSYEGTRNPWLGGGPATMP